MVLSDIIKWDTNEDADVAADIFYNKKISQTDFLNKYKEWSSEGVTSEFGWPVKPREYLEYRMYGFVPYNLSPIQMGIQFGHAVVEYSNFVGNTDDLELHEKYCMWSFWHKTFIILNGGTTNDNPERLGTLQQNVKILESLGVFVRTFKEPDLNDTTTAAVFLIDERIYKKDVYPDYNAIALEYYNDPITDWQPDQLLTMLGGQKNIELRTFLNQFKLAGT